MDRISKTSQELILEAQQQSQTIIHQATQRANQILTDAEGYHVKIQNLLDKSLAYLIAQHEERLSLAMRQFEESQKTQLSRIQQAYDEKIRENIDEVKKTTLNQISEFMDVVRKETIEAQRIIGQKINDELSQTQQELEKYKMEQIKKANETINKTVLAISEKVLGKSISIKDHERLVMISLEEAKKKGVFKND